MLCILSKNQPNKGRTKPASGSSNDMIKSLQKLINSGEKNCTSGNEDIVDSFTSFIPSTLAFSLLAKPCLMHLRNMCESCSLEPDGCRKGGLIGEKRPTVCENDEQVSGFLYVLLTLCSSVTLGGHSWGLQSVYLLVTTCHLCRRRVF